MERNCKYEPGEENNQDDSGNDPFLRRIKMQGKIIRKMLSQVDLTPDTPAEVLNDIQGNIDPVENDNKEDRNY